MNINKNGFTLIELMIAMGIGLVILAALYTSVNMAQRSSSGVGRKVVTQQDARTVLDIMAMEIRMTSLNTSASRTIWSTIPACAMGSLVPVKENKGLQIAGPNAILIAMDLGGKIESGANVPSGIIGDAPNEYIEYEFKNKTITRNVSCGGDNVLLGGEDLSTIVRNGVLGIPLFQYFDRLGNPTASIPDIRRVRITIVADTMNPDALTSQAKRMTYTTDVLVKNHVLCP